MAERRMISKEIYSSKNFLKLSSDTRDFYTYLVLYSDDDGIVDVYAVAGIMRLQNYEIHIVTLLAAGFIFELDRDEEIYYIERFQELNKIRAIYKVNSPHLSLLKEKRPEITIQTDSITYREQLAADHGLPAET